MSQLLARMARTLSSHWKRSLAAAVGVLVLLILAAGAGGEATDDYSVPGTDSQEAIDLFQAHSPAFGGADSTLVFTVEEGKVSDPGPRAAIEGALAEVRELDGVALVASPFEPGGQVSEDGSLASVDVRYSTDPAQIEKDDGLGADRGRRDRRARGSGRGSRHADRPRDRAGCPHWRAHRRGHRDHPADPAVSLRLGDGRDAHRRADRRRGGPDPACRAGRSARPALVRGGDRGDARPRRRDRLLVADHGPLPRAAGGRRQHAGCGRACGRNLRHHGGGRGPDRDGGDRRPARDRRPLCREDGHRRGIRGRRGCRVGPDDSSDHDGRLRAQARAEEARARRVLAGVQPLGRDRDPPAVGIDRRRRRGPADLRVPRHSVAPRPAGRRQPARVTHPARRLRPANRGVRPGLQRPVPARRRHAEGRARDRAAAARAPAGRRRHARHRLGGAGGGQRGRRDGHDLRHPDYRSPGRQDVRPARAPAGGRHPDRRRPTRR